MGFRTTGVTDRMYVHFLNLQAEILNANEMPPNTGDKVEGHMKSSFKTLDQQDCFPVSTS